MEYALLMAMIGGIILASYGLYRTTGFSLDLSRPATSVAPPP